MVSTTAAKLGQLASFYARRLLDSGLEFDMLFGPAYKGIALAAAVAIETGATRAQRAVRTYNRKEAKDHGEGACWSARRLAGRVVVIDDAISAGTSVRESVGCDPTAPAQLPVALAIALDRQERAAEAGVDKPHSAVQYVMAELGMQVVAVATIG